MSSNTLKWVKRLAFALIAMGAAAVILAIVPVAQAQEGSTLRSPDECAACHAEAYESWETTIHATTSERPEFIQAWAEVGRPAYCRECHGTGYDPTTGTFVFEDVTCQSCHWEVGDQPHPDGQMSVDTSSELCGTCHSGVHSPTYEEWLLSKHAVMNIDCITCHEPHNDGMRADNVNELCGRCHQESTAETAHNIEGMECSFCHMYGAQELTGPGEESPGTGHSFQIPPDVCASCHGMTHTLTVGDVNPEAIEEGIVESSTEAEAEPAADVNALETRVSELEVQASENLNLGLAGGGLGGILLGAVMVWIIRRGKTE